MIYFNYFIFQNNDWDFFKLHKTALMKASMNSVGYRYLSITPLFLSEFTDNATLFKRLLDKS